MKSSGLKNSPNCCSKGIIGLSALLLLLLVSCSPSLHQAFPYSNTSTDVYKVVTNDSAGVSFSGPADIDYLTNSDDAKKFLKKQWELNIPHNVLFVAASNLEPYYSFIITMDSEEQFDHPEYDGIRIHAFERTLNGHRFNLVAHGKQANLSPKDFTKIMDSLKIR